MRINRIINILFAAALCIWLTLGTILLVILLHNYKESGSIELDGWKKSHSEPFNLTNLLPGDSESRNFIVKVYHLSNTTLLFQMDKTSSGTVDLSGKLFVDVILPKSGSTVFSGTMAELTAHAATLALPKNTKGCTTVEYSIHVRLPSESGNEYQFSGYSGNIRWWVDEGTVYNPLLCIVILISILTAFIAAFFLLAAVFKRGCHWEFNSCWFCEIVNFLLVLLLILLLVITLCVFLRTPVVVPSNIFQTGGVVIEINNGEKVFDDSYIAPGETIKRVVTIKNQGTASVYYRLYLKNVSGALKEDLLFNFYYEGVLVKSVCPADLTIDNPLSSDVQLNADSNITYILVVLLPEQISNANQGEFFDFDIVVDAIQAKNNPRT